MTATVAPPLRPGPSRPTLMIRRGAAAGPGPALVGVQCVRRYRAVARRRARPAHGPAPRRNRDDVPPAVWHHRRADLRVRLQHAVRDRRRPAPSAPAAGIQGVHAACRRVVPAAHARDSPSRSATASLSGPRTARWNSSRRLPTPYPAWVLCEFMGLSYQDAARFFVAGQRPRLVLHRPPLPKNGAHHPRHRRLYALMDDVIACAAAPIRVATSSPAWCRPRRTATGSAATSCA